MGSRVVADLVIQAKELSVGANQMF
jgi:hypothetical protein